MVGCWIVGSTESDGHSLPDAAHFTSLAFLGVQPTLTLMLVQASMPVADVKEFIVLARASPGKFNYRHSSTGSAGHFAVNMLKLLTEH